MHARSTRLVLLYPCTIVDYVRLSLLAGALVLHLSIGGDDDRLWLRLGFVTLMGASSLLDLLDGYLARRLNHTSRFGMLLDLVIDLLTNTLAWAVTGWYLALVLVLLDWAVGGLAAAAAFGRGAHWKATFDARSPRLLQRYFRNNQRNALSAYGTICHSVFPLALYVGGYAIWIAYLTLPGLILYELVTLAMLAAFVRRD